MQRLLITGGCGYLGRALVGHAPAHGFQVRATWHEHRPPAAGDWVRVDVREAGDVREAMRGVDAVIHTAYRQDGDEWQVNAEGSAVVAEAARGRRLVHLSSDVVFRGDRGRYREADEPDPVNAYGRSKAEAERRVAAVHPAATIVRTSLIYGGAEPGPCRRATLRRLCSSSCGSMCRARCTWRGRTTSRGSTSPCSSAPTGSGSRLRTRRRTGRRT